MATQNRLQSRAGSPFPAFSCLERVAQLIGANYHKCYA